MVTIDEKVLKVFESVAHYIERLSGSNTFRVARFLYFLSVPFLIWHMLTREISSSPFATILSGIMLMIVKIILYILFYGMIIAGEILTQKVSDGVMKNPLKVWPGIRNLRLWLLFWQVFKVYLMAIGDIDMLSIHEMIFYLVPFFASCDPLPPGTRKKFFEKIRAWTWRLNWKPAYGGV